ncbi:MAG: carboxypeptidase-like regulatory domain-containing protein, partial [Acidobacteria bacterium]|nr:carboxypeptidase-like regulatory domain-containing protein [Acidobacteriota bacterium]
MKRVNIVLGMFFALFSAPAIWAQTAATSTVSGIVSDQNGAVVRGAAVTLTNPSTNASRTAQTNDEGQYVFTSIAPGIYHITINAKGFKQAVVSDTKFDVAKAYNLNVTLQVGGAAEVVQVTGGVGELQTSDSTIGNELKGEQLVRLPNATRSAVAFYTLQPLSMPYRGAVNDNTGGQVAGARTDQNTFSLDGADITDNTVGTHPVKPSGIGAEPIIPVPIDSVEELRVGTTNPNATFGRSSGGQVSFVTKKGTNAIHGSGYWYHQNDNLNANTWDRNRLARKPDGTPTVPEPELKDNRFGASLGGP